MPALPTVDELLQFLRRTPPFSTLSAVELAEVIHLQRLQKVVVGASIFQTGSPGDAWYLLFSGEIEVIGDTGEEVIRRLSPGSIFGELAVLDGGARTASVRASTDSIFLLFSTKEFNLLLDSGSPAAAKLMRALAAEAIEKHRMIVEELGSGSTEESGQ